MCSVGRSNDYRIRRNGDTEGFCLLAGEDTIDLIGDDPGRGTGRTAATQRPKQKSTAHGIQTAKTIPIASHMVSSSA